MRSIILPKVHRVDHPNKNKLNSNYTRKEALRIVDNLSEDEINVWYNSQCTQALLNALEGDLMEIALLFQGGAYIDAESASGTAQMVSKAVGMSTAINEVIDTIKDIKSISEGESE